MRERIYAVQVIAAIVTCAKCISLGSSAVSKVPIVDFAEVYARYDAFLLDQFGVVHVSRNTNLKNLACWAVVVVVNTTLSSSIRPFHGNARV